MIRITSCKTAHLLSPTYPLITTTSKLLATTFVNRFLDKNRFPPINSSSRRNVKPPRLFFPTTTDTQLLTRFENRNGIVTRSAQESHGYRRRYRRYRLDSRFASARCDDESITDLSSRSERQVSGVVGQGDRVWQGQVVVGWGSGENNPILEAVWKWIFFVQIFRSKFLFELFFVSKF